MTRWMHPGWWLPGEFRDRWKELTPAAQEQIAWSVGLPLRSWIAAAAATAVASGGIDGDDAMLLLAGWGPC